MDTAVFYFLNHLPHPGWADQISLWIDVLGDRTVAFVLIGLWLVVSVLRRRSQSTRQAACFLTAFILAAILVYFLKNGFDRPRPYLVLSDVYYLGDTSSYGSFPSGHATAFGAWAFFTQIWNVRGKWIWLGVALVGGVSRVYQGVHFPSDVLAGWLLGAAVTFFVSIAYRRVFGYNRAG